MLYYKLLSKFFCFPFFSSYFFLSLFLSLCLLFTFLQFQSRPGCLGHRSPRHRQPWRVRITLSSLWWAETVGNKTRMIQRISNEWRRPKPDGNSTNQQGNENAAQMVSHCTTGQKYGETKWPHWTIQTFSCLFFFSFFRLEFYRHKLLSVTYTFCWSLRNS